MCSPKKHWMGRSRTKAWEISQLEGSGNQEEPTQETRGISIRSRRRNKKSVNTRITTLRCWWSKYWWTKRSENQLLREISHSPQVCGFPTLCVSFSMSTKIWAHSESFSTLLTYIRFLSSMNSLVSNQGWALTWKDVPHSWQVNGFSLRVDSFMLSQDWALMKDSSTHLTPVRFLSGVDSLMIGQVWFPTESSATLWTFIRFLSSVDSLMDGKAVLILESFPTVPTSMGLIPGVSSFMSPAFTAMMKGFPHTPYTCKASLVWILLCLVSSASLLKAFPHRGHPQCFSWVWSLLCLLRSELQLKALPHSLHSYVAPQCGLLCVWWVWTPAESLPALLTHA